MCRDLRPIEGGRPGGHGRRSGAARLTRLDVGGARVKTPAGQFPNAPPKNQALGQKFWTPNGRFTAQDGRMAQGGHGRGRVAGARDKLGGAGAAGT